jgi:CDP-diglyceride synthetase
MLKFRIISGTLFLSAVAALYLWAPTWAAGLFIFWLCVLAVFETVDLLDQAGYPALKWTSLCLSLLWLAAAWFAASSSTSLAHLNWIMPGISAWMIFLGCLFRSDQTLTLPKLTGSFFTVAYIPGLMQFLVMLLFLKRGELDGRELLLYGILVIKCTDIGAFFIGSAIGKHKLIPRISPAKSWEGVLGGVGVAMGVSCLLVALFGFSISGIPFTLRDGLILGFLLGVSGVLGDLVESMLKRAAAVKDSGRWIKGMGGILDVLDSLLFAAPVLYLYVEWLLKRG